jgi:hypothetical protein
LYFAEVLPDHKIAVHRGPQTGPIIATAELSHDKQGTTQIHFPTDSTSPSETGTAEVKLTHVHHAPLHVHGTTGFTYDGKGYTWKGHTALVENEHSTLLAVFYSSWFDLEWNKVGRLEVTSWGQKMLDVTVVTALIVQERSDEERQMVPSPNPEESRFLPALVFACVLSVA